MHNTAGDVPFGSSPVFYVVGNSLFVFLVDVEGHIHIDTSLTECVSCLLNLLQDKEFLRLVLTTVGHHEVSPPVREYLLVVSHHLRRGTVLTGILVAGRQRLVGDVKAKLVTLLVQQTCMAGAFHHVANVHEGLLVRILRKDGDLSEFSHDQVTIDTGQHDVARQQDICHPPHPCLLPTCP